MQQEVADRRRARRADRGVWRLCLLAGAAALAGCAQVEGSDAPPPGFGPLGKPWFGCPDIAAVYVWPPVEGETFAGDRRPHAAASRAIVGVTVYPHGRLGIRMPGRGRPLTALFRDRSDDEAAPEPGLADPGWGYAEWGAAEWSCTRGYLDTGEVDLTPPARLAGLGPSPAEAQPGTDGRRSTVSWRLTRLADGSLALGLCTRHRGGSRSLLAWGDQSAGRWPEPELTTWQWSRLRRVGGE